MKSLLFTVLLIFGASTSAFAQSVTDPACLEKLSDDALYTKHKKDSYALLTPGKEDWLFRSHSDFKQDFTFTLSTIDGFLQLSKALKARGTELVIAFPPTRGIAAAQYLPDAVDLNPDKARASYTTLVQSMQKQGLHFVGITDFSDTGAFYRKQDHHWTVAGARQMAEEVAAYIKANIPAYETVEKQPFETISSGTYKFVNRFSDVTKPLCGFTLPYGVDSAVATSVKGQSSDDLFGDKKPPAIILVGTSNSKSNQVKSNFDGALRTFLQADVANNALSGVGYDTPLLAFLESERFRTNPPTIIIWEIPSYYEVKGAEKFFNQATALAANY